jgi:hypothetical protein
LLGENFNGWTQFGLQIGAKSHVSCSLRVNIIAWPID